jgi:single-strand DNA-binding protein
MTDVNQIVVIGNLTRDMELAFMQNGTAVGRVSIAVNRSWKKGTEYVDEVSYFDVSIFGKMAEGLRQYLLKGKKISVVGYLKQERWKDINGNARSKVSIIAENIQLLGGGNGNQQTDKVPF